MSCFFISLEIHWTSPIWGLAPSIKSEIFTSHYLFECYLLLNFQIMYIRSSYSIISISNSSFLFFLPYLGCILANFLRTNFQFTNTPLICVICLIYPLNLYFFFFSFLSQTNPPTAASSAGLLIFQTWFSSLIKVFSYSLWQRQYLN